jgi:hypothetical protein
MPVTAKLYQDSRQDFRQSVNLDGTLRDPYGDAFDVTIENLSATGFRIPAVATLSVDDLVSLGLPGVGMRQARVVRSGNAHYGCEFLAPLSPIEFQAAVVAITVEPVIFPTEPQSDVASETDYADRLTPPTKIAIVVAIGLLAWVPFVVAGLLAS